MALQTASPERTLAAHAALENCAASHSSRDAARDACAASHPSRDAAMEERLELFVQERTSGMVQHLRVRVHQAEVVLTGLARNYYTKQLATHAVLDSVEGVTLTNDIEVV